MKVNVFRSDKKDVHNGMVMIVQIVMEEFFGKRELFLDKNKEGFTQLIFEIADDEGVEDFTKKLSSLNPLYVVV